MNKIITCAHSHHKVFESMKHKLQTRLRSVQMMYLHRWWNDLNVMRNKRECGAIILELRCAAECRDCSGTWIWIMWCRNKERFLYEIFKNSLWSKLIHKYIEFRWRSKSKYLRRSVNDSKSKFGGESESIGQVGTRVFNLCIIFINRSALRLYFNH